MGVSINHSKSVEKEFFVDNTSERDSESLDFCVERLCCRVGCPVDIEVKNVIVVLIKRCGDDVERVESCFFHFVVPFCHSQPGGILDSVL